MRAISLVNRIEFEFSGNVTPNSIALGDLDNDECNELVVGNDKGKVVIFKGFKKYECIPKLNFVSCIAIGDVFNEKKNHLVIITADGWCYIYNAVLKTPEEGEETLSFGYISDDTENRDDIRSESKYGFETGSRKHKGIEDLLQIVCLHVQRIPANAKDILLADMNGDGSISMILGLTDRVVRSYKWVPNNGKMSDPHYIAESSLDTGRDLGRFIAVNKWECANQIGSITLHHSHDKVPSLLIAQPGGTFMRIKTQNCCKYEEKLENNEKTSSPKDPSTQKGTVDYQCLGISRMRSKNISTKIVGNFKMVNKSDEISKKPYALATLDGTIMLVDNEVIMWAMAVDHQIFELTKLDVTKNGSDDIVVCSWDGQTYILDQNKNCVRFHFEQPVQAFCSGFYSLMCNREFTCLVYVTFRNSVVIYYDIPLKNLTCKRFQGDFSRLSKKFENFFAVEADTKIEIMPRDVLQKLKKYLLHNNF